VKIIRVRKSLVRLDRPIESSTPQTGSRQSCEEFLTSLVERGDDYHYAGRDMVIRATRQSVVVYRLVPADFEVPNSL